MAQVQGITTAEAIQSKGYSEKSSNTTNPHFYDKIEKDTIPCYIINLLSYCRIDFVLEPDNISDNTSANFDTQDVRGRSTPYLGYDYSGPHDISFSITLQDDYCKEGILNTANHLKALCYPSYEGGILTPPRANIHIGDMINGTYIIKSVSVNWQKPYRNNVYMMADVSISATACPDDAPDYQDIWNNGSVW